MFYTFFDVEFYSRTIFLLDPQSGSATYKETHNIKDKVKIKMPVDTIRVSK